MVTVDCNFLACCWTHRYALWVVAKVRAYKVRRWMKHGTQVVRNCQNWRVTGEKPSLETKKIRRYNNSARWPPQQIPPLNFLGCNLVKWKWFKCQLFDQTTKLVSTLSCTLKYICQKPKTKIKDKLQVLKINWLPAESIKMLSRGKKYSYPNKFRKKRPNKQTNIYK